MPASDKEYIQIRIAAVRTTCTACAQPHDAYDIVMHARTDDEATAKAFAKLIRDYVEGHNGVGKGEDLVEKATGHNWLGEANRHASADA